MCANVFPLGRDAHGEPPQYGSSAEQTFGEVIWPLHRKHLLAARGRALRGRPAEVRMGLDHTAPAWQVCLPPATADRIFAPNGVVSRASVGAGSSYSQKLRHSFQMGESIAGPAFDLATRDCKHHGAERTKTQRPADGRAGSGRGD